MLNATTTNIDTLTVFSGSTFSGLTSITDLRSTSLNATSTNIGMLNLFGELFGTTGRFVTVNATTTNVDTLTIFNSIQGNVTSTGWFNIGTTDVVGTLGSLIGAGDLFVERNATTTGNLTVNGKVGIGAVNSVAERVYVSGSIRLTGNIYGSAISLDDQVIASKLVDVNNQSYYVDPAGATSALLLGKVGIGLTSPTTTLTVLGDSTFIGNASTTGWLSVGTTNTVAPLGSLFGAGDLFVSSNATTGASFSAPEICLNGDCRTSWPTSSGGATNIPQFWSYDYAANTISTVTSTTQLIATAASRLGTINATTTNIDTLTTFLGSTLNGLTTATDLRPSMLNATTTNIWTLTTFVGSTLNGLTNITDLRATSLNATTTNIGTLHIYSSFNISWDELTMKAATSTVLSLLDSQGRIGTLNATTTNVGTLNLFSELFGTTGRFAAAYPATTKGDTLNGLYFL